MISIDNKILARIKASKKISVWSNKDFLDFGSRNAVDQVLSRLVKKNILRRIARGIYDYKQFDKKLGIILSPNFDQIAQAVARNSGIRIQPSGAVAANLLGLSEQVPGKLIYNTDGKSKVLKIRKMTIAFKHVAPAKLQPGSEVTVMVTSALRYIGKYSITDQMISSLRDRLNDKNRKDLIKDGKYVESWIYEIIRKITFLNNGDVK